MLSPNHLQPNELEGDGNNAQHTILNHAIIVKMHAACQNTICMTKNYEFNYEKSCLLYIRYYSTRYF